MILMKLREYMMALNELVKKNPSFLDLDIIYSRDDEGNGYQEICFSPVPGRYEDGEFESCDYDEDDNEIDIPDDEINAICMN
mgnify:CR=1 FL=1